MKSDFLSMYVQLATARAITTGQGNAIFRLLKAGMVRNSWLTVARLAPNILSGSTTSRITRCDWPNFHFRGFFG